MYTILGKVITLSCALIYSCNKLMEIENVLTVDAIWSTIKGTVRMVFKNLFQNIKGKPALCQCGVVNMSMNIKKTNVHQPNLVYKGCFICNKQKIIFNNKSSPMLKSTIL